ncbi:MAG: SCP2 sterol-binding domain-containing protein [Alphaproteobacteria bacterium]|nr:SCP2 sterol-binding domain-containing protein [Alphaproteobacteria bacterium]MDP6812795.1 SCP2 sterol-binding domain-containing protein [Alphaproteobacteria bacterium]
MASQSERRPPPLSPVLVAGLALRPLPAAIPGNIGRLGLRLLTRRHPEVFERLRPLGDTAILIEPVDLPFRFVLTPGTAPPRLSVLRDGGPEPTTEAVVRGSLLGLLQLLQGRSDGDAMFFSRDLVIEGDTEAVVALRNAVDGSEIDLLADLAELFGPLRRPAYRLLRLGGGLFDRAARDLDLLREAVLAPTTARAARQDADLRALNEDMGELRRELRGRRRPGRRQRLAAEP